MDVSRYRVRFGTQGQTLLKSLLKANFVVTYFLFLCALAQSEQYRIITLSTISVIQWFFES